MAQRKLVMEGQILFADLGFWGQSLHMDVWDSKNRIELKIKVPHKSSWNLFKALGYSDDELKRVRKAAPIDLNLRGQKITIILESK